MSDEILVDADTKRLRWEEEERNTGQLISQQSAPAGIKEKITRAGVLVLAGIGAHSFIVPVQWAAAAVTVWLAVRAAAIPAAQRFHASREPQDPPWLQEMTDYRRGLDGRIPAATLKTMDRYMTVLAERWRSAHLYVIRRTGRQWLTIALTVPKGDRVIVYLGDHAVAAGPEVVAATLAHEARHLGRCRYTVTQIASAAGNYGWLILGWAVPRGDLLPAIVGFHVAVIAVNWTVEVSCDLGAAAAEGKPAMMAALDVMAVSARGRQRAVMRAVSLATGTAHPPVAVRRLIVRALP